MTDWPTTLADLATGAGTLVLAVATFASVRSGNRSARTAESSMLAGMRPILMNSRLQDVTQKVSFADGKWLPLPGGCAAVDLGDETVYLLISLRNVGTGMGILHGYRLSTGQDLSAQRERPDLSEFRPQGRDMYVAPGDIGFWQGALRDTAEPLFKDAAAAVEARDPITVDLLYGDFEGGQRVISRFRLVHSPFGHHDHGHLPARPSYGDNSPGEASPGETPAGESGTAAGSGASTQPRVTPDAARWLASVVRHWNVDRPDPRTWTAPIPASLQRDNQRESGQTAQPSTAQGDR
jgi:hypothetical protein